jgi:hypothetical protein
MTLVDVDITSEPLAIENFKSIAKNDYPFCIVGFQLKNAYDQERIRVKAKYNAEDILHFLPTPNSQPVGFRGLKLDYKPEFKSLIDTLNQFNTCLNDEINLEKYRKLLSKYDLSCDECYLYLRKGIYPVDGKCISRLSTYKYSIEDLYKDAFDVSEVPLFQVISSFTIFILCNESIFPKPLED